MTTHKLRKKTKLKFIIEILSIVISCISLIIAIISLVTSHDISSKQLEIDEKTSKPVINVQHTVNEEKQIIEKIIISNDGDAVEDIEIDVLPYYNVKISNYLVGGNHEVGFLLPIDDSYINGLKTAKYNARNEMLAVIEYTPKIESYIQDMKDFGPFIKEELIDGFYLDRISLEFFIKIQYKDLFEVETTEIYNCTLGINYIYDSGIWMMNYCGVSPVTEDSRNYELCNDICDCIRDINTHYEYCYIKFPYLETPSETKYDILKEKIEKLYNSGKFKSYDRTGNKEL